VPPSYGDDDRARAVAGAAARAAIAEPAKPAGGDAPG